MRGWRDGGGGGAGIGVNYTFKRTVLPHFRQIYSLTQHYLSMYCLSLSSSYLQHTELLSYCREYWMIYRGPGFLAVVYDWLLPQHLTPYPVSKLDQRHTGRLTKKVNLMTGEGGGSGGGAKSYDCEKTWSSINYSILSGILACHWSLPLTAYYYLLVYLLVSDHCQWQCNIYLFIHLCLTSSDSFISFIYIFLSLSSDTDILLFLYLLVPAL